MCISLRWTDDQRTILLCTVKNPWTLADLLHAVQSAGLRARETEKSVASIIVFEGNLLIPRRFLLTVPELFTFLPPNHNFHVVVTCDPLALTIHGIMQKIHPDLSATVHLVRTVDEAFERIRQQFQSLR